jgi:hypothetical protein
MPNVCISCPVLMSHGSCSGSFLRGGGGVEKKPTRNNDLIKKKKEKKKGVHGGCRLQSLTTLCVVRKPTRSNLVIICMILWHTGTTHSRTAVDLFAQRVSSAALTRSFRERWKQLHYSRKLGHARSVVETMSCIACLSFTESNLPRFHCGVNCF